MILFVRPAPDPDTANPELWSVLADGWMERWTAEKILQARADGALLKVWE